MSKTTSQRKLKLLVHSQTQIAELVDASGNTVKTYEISTARNGLSCVADTDTTPPGPLRISEKIGEGADRGSVFRARRFTGDIWTGEPSTEDLVLTRILWLEGAEPANANTKERYIYLHGTNQEHLLGEPVSHGCIRFSNQDIEEVFDLLNVGDEVFVD